MKKVKIGELKNKLSAYLRLVRQGQEVLIMAREIPVAKLEPYKVPKEAPMWLKEPSPTYSEIKKRWKSVRRGAYKSNIDSLHVLLEDRHKK